MVSTLFRDPQTRSSALAALGTPQPRAFGSPNRVETLDSTSNYYLVIGTFTVRVLLLQCCSDFCNSYMIQLLMN